LGEEDTTLKIGVFVQARLGSKRLPGKMMKEICGKPLIEHCLQTASQIKADTYHLLVPMSEVKEFFPIAERNRWNFLSGSENDVLSRFIDGIELTRCDVVVRVTGDKIIAAVDYIEQALSYIENYDLVSYEENPLLSTTYCVMKSDILLRARDIQDKACREHVKPCIKYLNGRHKILPVPEWMKKCNYNFSIDTQEDFDIISRLYKDLYTGIPINFNEALKWLGQQYIINS